MIAMRDADDLAVSGSFGRSRLARQVIFTVELAIAVPIAACVVLTSLAEKKALLTAAGERMAQEMALLAQLDLAIGGLEE